MKYLLSFIVACSLIVFSCSSKKNTIEGKWEISYIVNPEPSKSNVENAGFAWLNILSNQAKIELRNDSLFVNNAFKTLYMIKDGYIYSKTNKEYEKTYKYQFKGDTLVFTMPENGLIMKLNKKSP